jgi:DNA-binding transcriptional MerR regulator
MRTYSTSAPGARTKDTGTPGVNTQDIGLQGMHMQIGEVAARTELSLRTIRHYEDVGLVTPSARSQGGFRLYTEGDVQRLMVIRRMKPLGFTLEQMRDLLAVTDRLDGGEPPTDAERAELAARLSEFEEATATRAAELRVQLARAEEFAETLRVRATKAAAPGR